MCITETQLFIVDECAREKLALIFFYMGQNQEIINLLS